MAPEQTNAKRHGPNRATTVICLVLILAAALVIAVMNSRQKSFILLDMPFPADTSTP